MRRQTYDMYTYVTFNCKTCIYVQYYQAIALLNNVFVVVL